MFKRTIALLLCLMMLIPTLPVFASADFAVRHIEFTANTNGTTLNNVPTLQFLFYPDAAMLEQLDVSNVGYNVTDVYDDRMTVSFTLKLTASPTVAAIAEFRNSYDKITVTNVPASPDTKMIADGRFALRIRPQDMQTHSPELAEWSKTHPNWMTELGSYANTGCYAGTTSIVAHYDRDGVSADELAACNSCSANAKVTFQRISTADDGFSLSNESAWVASTWPDSTGAESSGISYYGNTLDEYVQYTPNNLEEGYYKVSIWNMKCNDQQDPMKMTATIHSNGYTFTNMPLAVTTATVNKQGTWTEVGVFYFKGTNDEYLRLVSTGQSNARPADAKFEKVDSCPEPEKVTYRHITTRGMGFSKSGTWYTSTMADSTGSTLTGVSYYGYTEGSYMQYAPYHLEPGWYDISFWNLKYDDHQDPMKMTGTVYSNGELIENIELAVSTATVNREGAWTKVGTYYFDGSNKEYFRLVSTGGSNARPADVKFEKNNSYVPPVTLVTEQRISTADKGFSLSNASEWTASTWPDSTGATHSGATYYGNKKGEYAQYTPSNLEPGYYDVFFWNMKCMMQQDPVKMTATVYANGKTKTEIPLEVTTATVDRTGTWTKIGTFYFAGTNDEYMRLVSNGGTNARPADAKFVKNDDFVPPPALGDKEVTFEMENGKLVTDGANGLFDMYLNLNGTGISTMVSIYLNNELLDKQLIEDLEETKAFFGTYSLNAESTVEVVAENIFGEETCSFDSVTFAPATDIVVDYKLFNIQREEEQFFIEAANYKVSAEIENLGDATNVQLVAALYEDADFNGRDGETYYYPTMKKIAMSDKTAIAKDGKVTLSVEFPIDDVTSLPYLKVFVWEGVDTMRPLNNERTYTKFDNYVGETFSIIPASFEDIGTWKISTYDAALNRTTMDGLKTSQPETAESATAYFKANEGTYKVWVHTKNFTDRPDLRHSKISVNGEELSKTFGQVGVNEWCWEDGGTVTLHDGENCLDLIDSSASYAKCDMIILSKDMDYSPTGSYEALLKKAPAVRTYNSVVTQEEMMCDFRLDRDFPGGNYVLNYMGNNEVHISPDSSDAVNTWWYWNFKATSDTARTVNFTLTGFEYVSLVGWSGVVYSTDDGETWHYLNDGTAVSDNSFSYTFSAGETVQFASVMPYQLSDLNEYIETIEDIEGVDVSVLCKTEEGRDVPLIRIGNPDAPYAAIFTARHHCSETTPSYMMEGVLTYLANNQDSDVFENYCFYAVPIVDVDGVENGDQGKGRSPHDHNRDYGIGKYAPTSAIEALAGTLDFQFAFDIHGPSLRDLGPYFSYYPDNAEFILAFDKMLIEASENDTTPNKIVYSGKYNRLGEDTATEQMKAWFHRVEGAPFAVTFEFPYSGGNEGDVNDAYTESRMVSFGNLTADTILEYLKTMQTNPEK